MTLGCGPPPSCSAVTAAGPPGTPLCHLPSPASASLLSPPRPTLSSDPEWASGLPSQPPASFPSDPPPLPQGPRCPLRVPCHPERLVLGTWGRWCCVCAEHLPLLLPASPRARRAPPHRTGRVLHPELVRQDGATQGAQALSWHCWPRPPGLVGQGGGGSGEV